MELTPIAKGTRFEQLSVLQQAYPTFDLFLVDAMAFLGFSTTPLQKDIGRFLETSSGDIMVQAQRSQAKSTITACFAAFFLIHMPTGRVLIVSAGGKQANEISTLVTKLILHMPELSCLRPDRSAGDRVSVEAFDIHHSLKGFDKSPSVACTGITANLQGKRADLLIADDVESEKNSRTQTMRELLMTWTKDFSSIVQSGRIIYLGTPQSVLSIYNTLPARGVTVRIWPGRFPTKEQLKNYGSLLAPAIRNAIAKRPELQSGGGVDGSQGRPTDPRLLNEEALQKKELAQGKAFFQLQHMLNTALADASKFPLKSEQLIVMRLGDKLPLDVVRGMTLNDSRKYQIGSEEFEVMWPGHVGEEYADPELTLMYIDPAGGGANADESGYVVASVLNSRIFVRELSGVPGGYSIPALESLAKVAIKHKVASICIEKNFGHGAFAAVFQPILLRLAKEADLTIGLEEDYSSGKKEDRIIDTIEPVLGRGSLIIDEQVLQDDWDSTSRYELTKRQTYTFATQFTRMSRIAGAMAHDDRIDALSGLVKRVLGMLRKRDDLAAEQQRAREAAKWWKNPLNHPRTPEVTRRSKNFRK